jgi:hypothetical protein
LNYIGIRFKSTFLKMILSIQTTEKILYGAFAVARKSA